MKFGHMAFVWGKDMSYIEQLCHIIDNSHWLCLTLLYHPIHFLLAPVNKMLA